MANEDKRRLRELEKENARLKKMYSELMIDHDILKEGLEIAKRYRPGTREEMVDQVKPIQSVRRKCVVLGFRRQSYYRRKQGHRPES